MYPESLPLDEIKNVVNLVRNGQVKEKVKEFAHDVWIVQGYAQGMIIGNPDVDFSLMSQSAGDAVDALEKLAASEDTMEAQMAIPWQMILSWAVTKLLELVEEKLL
jgi:hypothetical protein